MLFVIWGIVAFIVGIGLWIGIWMLRMKSPKFAEKERLKIEKKLQRSEFLLNRDDHLIQLSNAWNQQSKEALSRTTEIGRILRSLDAHIKRNAFASAEQQELQQFMEESAKSLDYQNDLTQKSTKLTNRLTSRAVTFRNATKHDAEVATLTAEIEEIEKQLIPLEAEKVAILEKLTEWLALGEQRPNNYGHRHPDL